VISSSGGDIPGAIIIVGGRGRGKVNSFFAVGQLLWNDGTGGSHTKAGGRW